MKKALEKYLDDYREYSELLSSSNRQLAFAGIAIIWIFRNGNGITPLIPNQLLLPLMFFALSLFFEILQYLSGTVIWKSFFSYNEKLYRSKKLESADDIVAPKCYQRIITTFFYLKVSSTILAYFLIFKFFIPLLK